MSAYFVSAETIADAAYALRFDVPNAPNPYFGSMGTTAIGQIIWQLNALALAELYGEDMEEHLGSIVGYTDNTKPAHSLDKWQRLRSLECLTYQCAEGTVPQTALFKAMEEAEHAIVLKLSGKSNIHEAKSAINNTPEYEKAGWGRG
jgi:hypothetical protein